MTFCCQRHRRNNPPSSRQLLQKCRKRSQVPTTSEATASRPSLINKISGLWSQKPDNAATAKTTPDLAMEKTDTPAERTSSILDLPRGDVVQHGNDDSTPASSKPKSASGTQGTLDNAGDDLDIPCFPAPSGQLEADKRKRITLLQSVTKCDLLTARVLHDVLEFFYRSTSSRT